MSWLCCFVRCIVLIPISTSLAAHTMTLLKPGEPAYTTRLSDHSEVIKNPTTLITEWRIMLPCASIVHLTKGFHFIAYESRLLLTRQSKPTVFRNRQVSGLSEMTSQLVALIKAFIISSVKGHIQQIYPYHCQTNCLLAVSQFLNNCTIHYLQLCTFYQIKYSLKGPQI